VRPMPPITVAPRLSESPTPQAWMERLISAYCDNLVTLRVLRHETPEVCQPWR
jgi:hypothetical protein